MSDINYINDGLIHLVNTAEPTATWMLADQMTAPPNPQSDLTYGIVNIISMIPLSFGNEKHTYLPDPTDKIQIEIKNYYHVMASIDVRSKDLSASNTCAKIIDYAYSNELTEYFFLNNLGLLEFSSIRNLTSTVSGQNMRRFQIDVKLSAYSSYTYEIDRVISAPINYNIGEF